MWEYEVTLRNDYCNRFFIWGYTFEDACNRNHFRPNELTILFQEYID